MKLNIFKNIISLTCLAIFLLILFAPFGQSLAQNPPLTISVSKNSIEAKEELKVRARIATGFKPGDGEVAFYTSIDSGGGGVEFERCELGTDTEDQEAWVCDAVFMSTKEGDFRVNAYILNENGTIYQTSNIIQIRVGEGTAFSTPTETKYTLLAPIPGLEKTINTTGECPFGNYLNTMIKIILGIAAVLAMVMIVMGGIQYLTSELVSGKEAGRETITHAILGLLIALGAYLILNTINPQLLELCLNKLP